MNSSYDKSPAITVNSIFERCQIYFIGQLTLVYSCTIDWIDKDLILSFIMYYFISLYLLYIHPSPPPILDFLKLQYMHNRMVRYTSFIVSIKIMKSWHLPNMIKFWICRLDLSLETEEIFITANIIQNTLDSTQHEDNNTNLLKMTSNV